MKEYPKRPNSSMCECGHDIWKHGTLWLFLFTVTKNKQCEVCMCPKFDSIVKPKLGNDVQ